MDLREISQYNAYRFNLINSQATRKPAGYINFGPENIAFYCVNKGGSGKEVATVDYSPAADESRTKVGMLVNLSEKYYAGYINGEKVCEKTFSDQDMRTGYMTGDAEFASLSALSSDYAVAFYDYKFYKGADKTDLPYAKIAEWDLSTATFAASTGTYSVSNENGLKVTMTGEGEMPEITLPAKALSGAYDKDMYYYEFVVNSGNLSDGSAFVIAPWGRAGSTYKTFFGIAVAKNTITFKRGNAGDTTTYSIPSNLVGTDIKIGLLIDQNDGSKGQTYVYINREYLWKTGNNDRTSYPPFAQKIVISSYAPKYDSTTINNNRGLFDTTQTTGDKIVVKSVNVYHCVEGATPVVTPAIPTEGAFTATASYSVDSIAAADGSVTATVTLSKVGNAGWYNKDLVIVASYAANGALLDYQVADGKVSGGSTATISKTVEVEAGGEVKVFLWDDMKTLVPTATFDVLD